jgi:plastocyanin
VRQLVLGAALAAALCAPALGAAPHRTLTISVDKMSFGPSPPGLRVGDRVRWINKDIFQHSATANDKSFDVDLKAGGQGEIVLKRPGVIAYACRYHPGMKGQLTVAR